MKHGRYHFGIILRNNLVLTFQNNRSPETWSERCSEVVANVDADDTRIGIGIYRDKGARGNEARGFTRLLGGVGTSGFPGKEDDDFAARRRGREMGHQVRQGTALEILVDFANLAGHAGQTVGTDHVG